MYVKRGYNQTMKKILLLIFTITLSLQSAQLEHIKIGNQDFSIVTETYNIYNSKGEVMKLYKEERDRKPRYILGLTLKDDTGTCSDFKIQEGAYEVKGTDITLYSLWDRRGKVDDAPYGARITHYKMLEDHTIVKKSSYIYIESARKNYNDESGMKYLFTPPKTNQDKEELNAYIKEIEEKYKGTFVFENEAKDLIAEVKKALKRKMEKRFYVRADILVTDDNLRG